MHVILQSMQRAYNSIRAQRVQRAQRNDNIMFDDERIQRLIDDVQRFNEQKRINSFNRDIQSMIDDENFRQSIFDIALMIDVDCINYDTINDFNDIDLINDIIYASKLCVEYLLQTL